jgi:SAM-dependent methyltransferase
MRLDALGRLRCPACLASGDTIELDPDPTRVGGGEDGGAPGDLLEGYLVCRKCRATYPVVGGVGVLPRDVPAHLHAHGDVYRRARIGDPRLARFVLGHAGPGGADRVPFEEVVARYGDLVPAEAGRPPTPPDAADDALDRALRAARARGPGLEVGCGVGRGTFVLAGRVGDATGVDASVARVRRARNVQVADEFRVPAVAGEEERPIDLARLARASTDFLVADTEALPFADGTFRTVVLRRGGGEGPWADPASARRAAERVAASDGLVLAEREGAPGSPPAFDPLPLHGEPARR